MATAKKERHITITEQIARLDISPALQMMYAEIVHLSNGRGYCYANNQYFESRFRKSDSCIIRWVKALEKRALVFRLVIRSHEGTERRLYIEKATYEAARVEHKGQTLTGRQLRQPGLSEVTTGGSQKCTPGVVKSKDPGSQNQTPGVVKSEHHNTTVNITSNTTVEYSSSTEVEESSKAPESDSPDLKKKKEEKEKGSAQKEKETSAAQLDKLFLAPYYDWYKERLQAKKVKIHESGFPALTRIRHFLTDAEGGVDEALATWMYILENWARLPNFLQSQIKLRQIDSRIDDFLVNVRKLRNEVADVPLVSEAIDLYKDAFYQLKGIPANTNGKGQQHMAETLTYLKDFKEGNTWEQALKGFEFILKAWPELEKEDKFYKDNFTLSYINGNTSKIISIIKSRGGKRAELTVDSAQAWLERNRLSA
jgi:hypothetical protein